MHTPKDSYTRLTATSSGSRRKHVHDPSTPATIRTVFAEADSDGRLTVTVDGEQLTPDLIGRAAFGSLLDKLLRARGSVLRVQVHEADGSSYTDVLTPPAQLEPEPAPPSIGAADPPQMPALLEITGDGFVPGEDVAFAPIIIHSSVRSDGSVRSLVEFTDNVREVVVFGRVSGTINVVKVPQ